MYLNEAMILLQHHISNVKTSLFSSGGALRLSVATIALMAVCAGVPCESSAQADQTAKTPQKADVFEDVFAPVSWHATPRSSRVVQTSQWRATSQSKTQANTEASKPRVISARPESEVNPYALEKTAERYSRQASAVRKPSSTRRVKPAAYDNIITGIDDGGYVLDPVSDKRIQGEQIQGEQIPPPAGQPMEIYDEGMGGEPMHYGHGGMVYGDNCGDPAMMHPWQGGEYWFNPRYGLPPFLCRFPHWLHFARGRLYFRGEYLVWWTSGSDMPALVTTSPTGTSRNDAGVLGRESTTVLYGDEKRSTGQQSGGRYTLGYWFSPSQCFGWEMNYLSIGKLKDNYSLDSDQNPIIARPFTNAVTGGQDSTLVAFDGTQEASLAGSIDIELLSEFRSFEFLLRRALVQSCDHRIDVVFGYRYGRFDERLTISDTVEDLSGEIAQEFEGTDIFDARNRFNGAEFGVILNKRSGRWGMELLAKLALGRTENTVVIDGATTITTGATSNEYDGSVLALPSNIGTYRTKEIAVMPEIGANLMYNITPRISFTFGYTFIYLSHVARPGDQIDTMVNSSQFPPGTLSGPALPEFQLRTTDYWAHGMNFGFDFRF